MTAGFAQNLEQIIWVLQLLHAIIRHESGRDGLSSEAMALIERIASDLAEAHVGRLGELKLEEFETLEKHLDTLLNGFTGVEPEPMDGKAFVQLQTRIFIEPQKRGPKYRADFDEAFRRHEAGESTSDLAREYEPEAYERDSVNTIQRYSTAFSRRKRST